MALYLLKQTTRRSKQCRDRILELIFIWIKSTPSWFGQANNVSTNFLDNLGPLTTKRIKCDLWNVYDSFFQQTKLQLRVNYPYKCKPINISRLIDTLQPYNRQWYIQLSTLKLKLISNRRSTQHKHSNHTNTIKFKIITSEMEADLKLNTFSVFVSTPSQ